MYNFILHISFMVGLAVMIYLIARAAPRVSDEIFQVSESKKRTIDRIMQRIPLEKLDIGVGTFLEKILRKMKLGVMRVDNVVGSSLEKVKKMQGGNGKESEKQPRLFDEPAKGAADTTHAHTTQKKGTKKK